MSEFDAFASGAPTEEDPAAAFLAREQDQMAELEGEDFGGETPAQTGTVGSRGDSPSYRHNVNVGLGLGLGPGLGYLQLQLPIQLLFGRYTTLHYTDTYTNPLSPCPQAQPSVTV